MDITLSPNFERQAIAQIEAAKRDENVAQVRLSVVKVTARLLLVRFLRTLANGFAKLLTRRIERRNDRLRNHVLWFRSATEELRALVANTGEPAGDRLIVALDELATAIDVHTARLLSLVEVVNARSRLGFAIHRSIRILSELKASATEMRGAGCVPEIIDATDARLEHSRQRFASLHAEILSGRLNPRATIPTLDATMPAHSENAG
jgi:hypothetical protein